MKVYFLIKTIKTKVTYLVKLRSTQAIDDSLTYLLL